MNGQIRLICLFSPEIKTILNGYILQNFFSGWTLLIKALGITLSVASGLSLGKEGPMVHVACSIGSITSKLFDVFRDNEGEDTAPDSPVQQADSARQLASGRYCLLRRPRASQSLLARL